MAGEPGLPLLRFGASTGRSQDEATQSEGRASGTAASSSAPFHWSSPSRPAGSISSRSLPAVSGGSLTLSLTTRRKRGCQQHPRTNLVSLACIA